MIAADTNILVRHLTQDDSRQAEAVGELFRDLERQQETVFVGQIVLCELCWVLASAYGFGKVEIAEGIRSLLDDSLFVFEARPTVETALSGFRRHGGQFPDHLIGVVGIGAGATTTYTFDRRAAKIRGFSVLQ